MLPVLVVQHIIVISFIAPYVFVTLYIFAIITVLITALLFIIAVAAFIFKKYPNIQKANKNMDLLQALQRNTESSKTQNEAASQAYWQDRKDPSHPRPDLARILRELRELITGVSATDVAPEKNPNRSTKTTTPGIPPPDDTTGAMQTTTIPIASERMTGPEPEREAIE
ncbi:unnamed protein product [Cyclocybe aegerita]|uniref:Uncharacterized protein n=1 Tax=Cyclocybe aegerita TaxID=1973307 RepID=A0A8S0X682_CYCAE|nr:unnamed protein product [Cyclocybe aegerita]